MPIKLRRTNNIRTIQASLAIEGNTLEVEQVTKLLEGKRVLGPLKDIQEVTNAIKVYERIHQIDPFKSEHMLDVHRQLMSGLAKDAGAWRSGQVGVWQGKALKHMAPPAKRVPALMTDLFAFISSTEELSWLVKACVFHYELEFIHPFSDGNGRMGRLWQQLLLMKQDPIFEFMPVEVMIRQEQDTYYKVLGQCDEQGDSTLFIEFSLQQILSTLENFLSLSGTASDSVSRLEQARARIENDWFSRKDYMDVHVNLSTATASRDLVLGIEHGFLEKTGTHNQMRYRFK